MIDVDETLLSYFRSTDVMGVKYMYYINRVKVYSMRDLTLTITHTSVKCAAEDWSKEAIEIT